MRSSGLALGGLRAALIAALAAFWAGGDAGAQDRAFQAPRPVTIIGYSGDAMEPFITRDGRYLLFNNRNDPPERTDLFYAERVDDFSFVFRGPVGGANSPALDGVASVDSAGTIYFVSTRSYRQTQSSLYRGRFAAGVVSGVDLAPGVSPHKPGIVDFDAEISGDGQSLYVAEGDFRPFGRRLKAARIVLFHRLGAGFQRAEESDRLLARINGEGLAYAPSISGDGLELFFTRLSAIKPGAAPQLYRVARRAVTEPFGPPTRVETGAAFVEAPSLTADGRGLYFHRREGDRYSLWRMQR